MYDMFLKEFLMQYSDSWQCFFQKIYDPSHLPTRQKYRASLLYNYTKNGLSQTTGGPEIPKICIGINNFANLVYILICE
jgi:hypothetical protein